MSRKKNVSLSRFKLKDYLILSHNLKWSHSDTDENQNEFSISLISNRYGHNKLMQTAPKSDVIVSANIKNQKLIDK